MAAVQEGSQVGRWDVVVREDCYVLAWDRGTVTITSAQAPVGIAIDAACEFMDRVREGNTPPFIDLDDHHGLMQFCVGRSWKQR